MTALTVASVFAGCGGSSLGYRAAGLQVRYANEINPRAAATYELNSHVIVDRRDVQIVKGSEIIAAVGRVPDILDGSPPCQDFSMAGARDLEGGNAALYYEFVRLVGEIMPAAFCAENVVGFARGQSYGRHFLPIIRALRAHGYAVDARVLEASWHGVPQARERGVLIGVRRDLNVDLTRAFPRNGPWQTTIRDVLPDAVRLVRVPRDGLRVRHLAYRQEKSWPASRPAPTFTTKGVSMSDPRRVVVELRNGTRRPITIDDAKLLCGFPIEFQFPDSVSRTARWKMLGNAVPPPMAAAWARSVAAVIRHASERSG